MVLIYEEPRVAKLLEDGRKTSDPQGLGNKKRGVEGWGLVFHGYGISFWEVEKFWRWMEVAAVRQCEGPQHHRAVCLKMARCQGQTRVQMEILDSLFGCDC